MSINYNFLYSKDHVKNIKHYSEKELSYKVYDNAYFLSHRIINSKGYGGICDARNQFVKGTHVNGQDDFSYPFNIEDVVIKHKKVIYLGIWHKTWGHCFTDNLKFVWFLFSKDYEKYREYDLVYDITEPCVSIDDWNSFKKLMEILGVDLSKLKMVNTVTQYDEIVVPDESFFSDEKGENHYTKEYLSHINSIRNYAEKNFRKMPQYERIYFSYKSGTKDKNIGLEKFDTFFEKLGYEIVFPERFTFDEQLNILLNCKELATTIGSCSHNTVFLRENTKVILIPRSWYLNPYQDALNEIVNLDIHYVDSSLSVFSNIEVPTAGPMYFFVSNNLLDFYNLDKKKDKLFWKRNLKDIDKYIQNYMHLSNHKAMPPEKYNEQFIYYYKLKKNLSLMHKVIKLRKKLIPFIIRKIKG